MTATSIDARSLDSADPDPVTCFRGRNAQQVNGGLIVVDGQREPTQLGWYLIRGMGAHDPPMLQKDFADAMDVSQSTVTRWIYDPIKPRPELLHRAAAVLGADPHERARIRHDLLALLDYVDSTPAAATTPAEPEPAVVARLRRILAGPLTDAERATLTAVIDGVIQPYEQRLPPKRRRTG